MNVKKHIYSSNRVKTFCYTKEVTDKYFGPTAKYGLTISLLENIHYKIYKIYKI